jgi:hypothetical protein
MMASILTKLRSTAYETAVAEALAASDKLNALPAGKLAAEPYLREAAAKARTTTDKLAKLEAHLTTVAPEEREAVDNFLAGAQDKIRNVCADPPSGNLHTLLPPCATPLAEMGTVVALAMQLGTNPFELVALAVLRETRAHPEAFGPRTLPHKAFDAEHSRLHAAFLLACAEIAPTAAAEGAVEFVAENASGLGRQFFRWAGARTPVVAHAAEAGERLVAWIAAAK